MLPNMELQLHSFTIHSPRYVSFFINDCNLPYEFISCLPSFARLSPSNSMLISGKDMLIASISFLYHLKHHNFS